MKDLITPEVAKTEVEKWLEFKKVGESKVKAYEDYIEALTNGVCDGFLILNPEDFSWKQILRIPIGKDSTITELNFKSRLKVREVHEELKGVSGKDGDGRVVAYIAALTDKAKGIIRDMDTEDYSIAQAIATFFL